MRAQSGLLDLELLPKPTSMLHQLHHSFIVTQFPSLRKLPVSKTWRERRQQASCAATGRVLGDSVHAQKGANILLFQEFWTQAFPSETRYTLISKSVNVLRAWTS